MSNSTPTSDDVARLAQVSRPTVNRVLGGYGYASEEVRQRVRDAATALGYRPNAAARTLLTGKSRTIGVVVVDIMNPFFAAVVAAVSDIALRANYETFIMSSNGDIDQEGLAIDALLAKQVDGMIVAPNSVTHTVHLERIVRSNVPLVLIDRVASRLPCDSVDIDNVRAGQDATNRLLDDRRQCIGIITHAQTRQELDWAAWNLDTVDRAALNPSALRLLGFLIAHRDRGVRVLPELVITPEIQSQSAARTACEGLMRLGVDGLFITDNILSIGAYRALKDSGRRLPSDLSVVAFDDVDWTSLTTPSLTVVSQPFSDMGARAADQLFLRIDGPDPATPPRAQRLDHTLIERESTRDVHA